MVKVLGIVEQCLADFDIMKHSKEMTLEMTLDGESPWRSLTL
jgi:hypothetical protein